jgi:hypothetical protein
VPIEEIYPIVLDNFANIHFQIKVKLYQDKNHRDKLIVHFSSYDSFMFYCQILEEFTQELEHTINIT